MPISKYIAEYSSTGSLKNAPDQIATGNHGNSKRNKPKYITTRKMRKAILLSEFICKDA